MNITPHSDVYKDPRFVRLIALGVPDGGSGTKLSVCVDVAVPLVL